MGINPIKNIIALMEEFLVNKKLFNKENVLMVNEEIDESIKNIPNNLEKVVYRIEKTANNSIRGGQVIGIVDGKIIRAKKEDGKIIIYSKNNIEEITDNQIENLFVEAYQTKSKDFVIAFAERGDTSIEAIENRIEIARKQGIIKAETEIKFDLSENRIITETVCEEENKATGANTFIITRNQSEMNKTDIENLMTKGYRFIVKYKSNEIPSNIELDGIQIDATGVESKEEAKKILEKLKDKCNIEKSISIEFSSNMYEELKGLNIFKEYGVMPIVKAGDVEKVIGKKEVIDITKSNVDSIINNEEVVAVIGNEKTKSLFSEIKEYFMIKTSKYGKGLNLGLREGKGCDISKVAEILRNNQSIEGIEVSELGLLQQDIVYLEYLINKIKSSDSEDKGRYEEEAKGYITGLAMKELKNKWIKILRENGININEKDLEGEAKGQYELGFLKLMLSMIVSGVTEEEIKRLLVSEQAQEDGWTKSAKDVYEEKLSRALNLLPKVLMENDKEIKVMNKEELSQAKEDIMNINLLLQDRFRDTKVAQEVKISALEVRKILSAA